MKWKAIIILSILFAFVIAGVFLFCDNKLDESAFLIYKVDCAKKDLQLYWKDEQGQPYRSIQNLKAAVEKNKQQLLFAMNAGMYKADNSPQGLFIQNQKEMMQLDTASGSGNFYLKPNGVFYITTDNVPVVCQTEKFVNNGQIKYATQSGPMLLANGQLHPAFKKESINLNIRNGVGILPDNKVIFVMSKKPVSFYDFASCFKEMGCSNALYLDGLVSRTYLPEKKWTQLDGNFGVIIGVTAPAQ